MIKAGNVNLAMVKRVAELLGPLRQKVVFLESLPGHLPPDSVSQARLPKITTRIEKIATMVDMGDLE
jgi:hypothetical protein